MHVRQARRRAPAGSKFSRGLSLRRTGRTTSFSFLLRRPKILITDDSITHQLLKNRISLFYLANNRLLLVHVRVLDRVRAAS
jgi:hypothetical protein